MHSPWAAVIHFFTHALSGIVIFIIVALPAVGLNFLVKYLEALGTSPYILAVLTALEYIVLTADAGLYLVLLAKSMYKGAKELEL